MSKQARQNAGQGTVELGLVIPLCIGLMLGVVEAGRLAYAALTVSNAASAGARYGAQSVATAADVAGMESVAASNAQGMQNFQATASCYVVCNSGGGQMACGSGSCSSGQQAVYVTVNTSAAFNPLANYPFVTWPSAVSGQATMRVE
jgi:Flp pilus assembly protein TadG